MKRKQLRESVAMQIYVQSNGQQRGPFNAEQINQEIHQGRISIDETFAWHEGCTDWIPLKDLPGIVALPSFPQGSIPAPPFPPPPPRLKFAPQDRQKSEKLGIIACITGGVAWLILIVAVIIAGIIEVATPGFEKSPLGNLLDNIVSVCCAVISLVSVGFGIGAFIRKEKEKIFAIIGIALSVVLWLIFVSFLTSIGTVLSALSIIALIVATLTAIHVAQRVERPIDKLVWLFLFAILPLIGSAIYFFTKYQRFREVGKGGLLFDAAQLKLDSFFKLSEAEKASHPSDDSAQLTSEAQRP